MCGGDLDGEVGWGEDGEDGEDDEGMSEPFYVHSPRELNVWA